MRKLTAMLKNLVLLGVSLQLVPVLFLRGADVLLIEPFVTTADHLGSGR